MQQMLNVVRIMSTPNITEKKDKIGSSKPRPHCSDYLGRSSPAHSPTVVAFLGCSLEANQESQNGFFAEVLRELRIQGSTGRQGFCFLPESQSGLSVIASTVPLTNFFVPVPSFRNVCDELDALVFFCELENILGILGIDQPWAIAEEAENEIAMPRNTTHILSSLTKTPSRIGFKTGSVR